MPFTAGEVIDEARGVDPVFTRERHPSAVLYPFLKRLQRHYVAEWLKKDSRALMESYDISLPLATFTDGHELVDGGSNPLEIIKIHEPAEVLRDNGTQWDECKIIDFVDRLAPRHFPSIWIQNGFVYLTEIEERWTAFQTIRLWLTLEPAEITGQAIEFVLPNQAQDAVVQELAAFMAKRTDEEELTRRRDEYIEEAVVAKKLFLDDMYQRQGATKGSRRGV